MTATLEGAGSINISCFPESPQCQNPDVFDNFPVSQPMTDDTNLPLNETGNACFVKFSVPPPQPTTTNITLAFSLGGTWNLQFFSGPGLPIAPINSGDNQHFTLPVAPGVGQVGQLYLNGQLLGPNAVPVPDYTLTGTNLTLASALTGIWNLQFFIVNGTSVIPTNSGNNQYFTVPTGVASGQYYQLYLNGQLLSPGSNYQFAGTDIMLSSALSGIFNLQFFIITGVMAIPVNSGDNQHFTILGVPLPLSAYELFLNGLLLASYSYTAVGITPSQLNWFSLERLVMQIGRDPWTPVSGL
jgi:hypothetical protein